jgi:hypothetical protein
VCFVLSSKWESKFHITYFQTVKRTENDTARGRAEWHELKAVSLYIFPQIYPWPFAQLFRSHELWLWYLCDRFC